MASLPSRYGPSVTTGGPSGPNRTDVAVSGPCSWLVPPILARCSANQAPTSTYLARSQSGGSAANTAASSASPQNSSTYFMPSPPPSMSNKPAVRSTSWPAGFRGGLLGGARRDRTMSCGIREHRAARELAAINELLDQAAAGTGGLLVLTAPAGSGRTALAEAAADRAAQRGFEVIWLP